MKYLIIIFTLLFTACTVINVNNPNVAPEQYDPILSLSSVVKVSSGTVDGKREVSASAFAIDKNYLVTADHACYTFEDGFTSGSLDGNIKVTYLNLNYKKEFKYGVEIVKRNKKNDLCLLKMNNHGFAPLKIANYSKVKIRDIVHIVGSPLGFMLTVFSGKVIDPASNDRGLKNKLIVSAAAANGNSGGPVLNDKGQVIGVLIMGHASFDHLSICVPSYVLKKFIKNRYKIKKR